MYLRKADSQGNGRFPWKLMQYISPKFTIGVISELLNDGFQLPRVNANLLDLSLLSRTSSLFQMYSSHLSPSTFQDCCNPFRIVTSAMQVSLLRTPRGEFYSPYSRCAQPMHSLLSSVPVIKGVSCISTSFRDGRFEFQDE